MLTKKLSIPLQTIQHPLFSQKGLTLEILRTDKTDPVISGNKWFKLKYNLIEAKKQGCKTLLSFGGPYSNHLHALAAAGKASGFNTIGIIRGEQHSPLNPTLSDITRQGMKLYYINRQTYRNKHLPEVIEQLKQLVVNDDPFNEAEHAGELYLVPEGGTNKLAVSGAAEIAAFIPEDADYICVPCGTGGTIAGIITGFSLKTDNRQQPHLSSELPHKESPETLLKVSNRSLTKPLIKPLTKPRILGFPAMKGGQFLDELIHRLIKEQELPGNPIEWELIYDWHFGGFGKLNRELARFIQHFEKKYPIELDPVYTAKMMYGIVSMVEKDLFPEGSKIVLVHTGGLQGKRGMEQRFQSLISNN